MKKKTVFLIFLTLSICLFSQDNKKLDSLQQVLNNSPQLNGTEDDTLRLKNIFKIAKYYETVNTDSAIAWYTSFKDTSFTDTEIELYPIRYKVCANIFKNFGYYCNRLQMNEQAFKYYNLAFKIYEKKGNKKQTSIIVYSMGIFCSQMGKFQLAASYYAKALPILKEVGDKTNYATCLKNLAVNRISEGRNSEAVTNLEEALIVQNEIGNPAGIADCNKYLGVAYTRMGLFDKALVYLEKSLEICLNINDSMCIADSYGNIASAYVQKSQYAEATKYYEKSLEIEEKNGNTEGIARTCINLGQLYKDQGNDKAAIELYMRSKDLCEKINDINGLSHVYNSLGNLYSEKGEYEKSIECFEKSLVLFEKLNDVIGISGCIINIGISYGLSGNYQKAMEYLERGKKMVEDLDFKPWIQSVLFGIGNVHKFQGHYPEAISYYEESFKINELLNDLMPLALGYPQLAVLYTKMIRPDLAIPLYKKSCELAFTLLKNNFTILSENEKEIYLEKMKETFDALHLFNVISPYTTDSISGLCYNNELILKGLCLKSSRNMLETISNSSDTTLKNTYEAYKSIQNEISSMQGILPEERPKDVDLLQKEANKLERKLVQLSSSFADIQKLFDYRWQNVRNSLKKGEAAIEFISFKDKDNPDSTIYAAMILTIDSKKPIAVRLFEEKEMERILGKSGESNFDYVSELYTENQEKTRNRKSLFKMIWLPLEPYLKDIKTIYYTPSGVLNKISFASVGDGKILLSDKYILHQLSSTGKLINAAPYIEEKNMTAAVFGGIDYNYEVANNADNAMEWKYLEGTESEKETISTQMKNKKVFVMGFSGKEASELAFKNLFSENGPKSEIVHVATHGFFYTDPDQEKQKRDGKNIRGNIDSLSSETGISEEKGDIIFRSSSRYGVWQFMENKNPMMRSGLVFAGANRVWAEEKTPDENEGILTAQEASRLDMSETALVVLSACETGLGDIRGNEGVFGLQRAFKMAGVKYIIMSLWQVPDKETEEFMTSFYAKFLKSKDIRNAFTETQKEMRAKYDPYFWGAFVLVE